MFDILQEMYKKAAEFWAELRVELLAASAFLTEEKPNLSQLWRIYWASHQVLQASVNVTNVQEYSFKLFFILFAAVLQANVYGSQGPSSREIINSGIVR